MSALIGVGFLQEPPAAQCFPWQRTQLDQIKKQKRGVYADAAGTAKDDLEDKVADFSYQNDVLAQWIVGGQVPPTIP